MVFQRRLYAPRNERQYVKMNFALLCLICAVLLGCGENPDAWPTLAFAKEKWTKTEEEERYVFARDLIANQRLDGMSKQEVIDLLGPPSYSEEKVDYVTYILKISPPDLYILEIGFRPAEHGPVVGKVFVRTD